MSSTVTHVSVRPIKETPLNKTHEIFIFLFYLLLDYTANGTHDAHLYFSIISKKI